MLPQAMAASKKADVYLQLGLLHFPAGPLLLEPAPLVLDKVQDAGNGVVCNLFRRRTATRNCVDNPPGPNRVVSVHFHPRKVLRYRATSGYSLRQGLAAVSVSQTIFFSSH